MYNLLSKVVNTEAIPEVFLQAVWHVSTGPHYNVTRARGGDAAEFVAVRTVGGRGELELWDGTGFSLEADTLAFFRLSQVGHYRVVGQEWKNYWFEFDASREDLFEINRIYDQSPTIYEQAMLDWCFLYLSSDCPTRVFQARSYFSTLLARWLDSTLETGSDKLTEERLAALLQRARRENLQISDIARELTMCERTFRNTVKKVLGMSPKEYLLKKEMEMAMEVLRTTQMTVEEISDRLSYSSPSYFSRTFKHYYGISPLQARKHLSENSEQKQSGSKKH